jgi:predicted nucleic acid-binding protein
MVLVDTSVWNEIFRSPARLELASVADLDEVVTAWPIVQEVLQGFIDEAPFRTAREAMLSMPIVESPMTEELFLEAAHLYRRARRAGFTVRSSTECLIAACAIRHHLTVAHVDRDYEHLAKVSTLLSRRIAAR